LPASEQAISEIEAQPTSEQPTAAPHPTTKPKKQPKPKKLAAIKAERIGGEARRLASASSASPIGHESCAFRRSTA
jgi:hypothetical protein